MLALHHRERPVIGVIDHAALDVQVDAALGRAPIGAEAASIWPMHHQTSGPTRSVSRRPHD
jgi:hypothetical protein